ncbi:MAG: pilus assembly protein PilM [Candidatus Eremiobacteraeota bacterium]|nr:pilus assembly protein PilM [Candidatus Eremiobacteraeota bacterium]
MKSLPLGIDIGASRLRIAVVEMRAGNPAVCAVATRDLSEGSSSSGEIPDPDYVATLLEDAVQELGVRERRCVCSLGEPDAVLRAMIMPRMSPVERAGAIRLEADRFIDYSIDEAIVRTHPVSDASSLFALGIVRKRVLSSRLKPLKKAGLKVCGVDHEAYALSRILPGYEAVVDIGTERTSIHLYTSPIPITLHYFSGGAEISRSIARDLSIDLVAAERRKRILGTSGAGEAAQRALAAEIAALIGTDRNRRGAAEKIAIVGNSVRLPGLRLNLELATNRAVEIGIGEAFHSGAYPVDVLASAAPDWNLAVGLATWGR